jgi:hypothetical protein
MRSQPEFPLSRLVSWSVSCEIPSSPGEGQHDVEEGVVWEYRRLLDYRIVNGKLLVLVPWIPTWEPPDEYPEEEEVDRVRRKYQAQTLAEDREGRAPSSMFDSGRGQIGMSSLFTSCLNHHSLRFWDWTRPPYLPL